MRFPTLFSEGSIGSMNLPNRILMGSMHLGYEGLPNAANRMAEFYAARARGGAALLITGGCAINQEAIGGANFSCIYRPEDRNTLRFIANRVHQEGGRIGLQLFHAGRYATRQWLSGLQPVAPSAVRSVLHPGTPREMTEEDIHRTIADFAQAAESAREAGFDCVEVMGSEGYLINQFFSPVTNKRNDDWGGSLENRSRFARRVMEQIRALCGKDFPVIFRMSGIDLMPRSNSWEDTFYFAKTVQAAGADALNIGIGWHESRIPTISMLVPRSYFSFVSARIKAHVKIPCICSNRINDPTVAEEVIASGEADFVSMARALLADPEFPRKAEQDRSQLINTCIACNQACLDNAFRNEPTGCIVNPEAGREFEMRLKPASYRKKIAVVGAGPAGLEAAKVLAQRNHRVTLFEKQERLGGQLLYAIRVPGKEEFCNTIRYYENHLKELQVSVELQSSPTENELQHFDAVILATGARPFMPAISGAQSNRCMDYDGFFSSKMVPARDILIIGAGGIGCDIAHILSDSVGFYPSQSFFDQPDNVASYEEHIRSLPRTLNVTLTRRGKRIGEKLGPTTRWALIQLLENRGVRMLSQLEYQSITGRGLHAKSRGGKDLFVEADLIIFAAGQTTDHSFFNRLKDKMEACYLIGAARQASEANAQTAIWEASHLAREL